MDQMSGYKLGLDAIYSFDFIIWISIPIFLITAIIERTDHHRYLEGHVVVILKLSNYIIQNRYKIIKTKLSKMTSSCWKINTTLG